MPLSAQPSAPPLYPTEIITGDAVLAKIEASPPSPSAFYLSGLSKGSIRTTEAALIKVARFFGGEGHLDFPWWNLTSLDLQTLRTYLEATYAPAYGNKILAAVYGVFTSCYQDYRLMSKDDAGLRVRKISQDFRTEFPQSQGRALPQQDLSRLLDSFPSSLLGVRDRAIVALFLGGLRRSEVSHLLLGNFDRGSGEVFIYQAKGNKSRESYLPPRAKQFVIEWLELRGDADGSLVCRLNKSGAIDPEQRLGEQSLYDVVKRSARVAGLGDLKPHDLRRSVASGLLDQGVDVSTVAKLLGHASIQTTIGYDRRGEDSKIKAMENFGV